MNSLGFLLIFSRNSQAATEGRMLRGVAKKEGLYDVNNPFPNGISDQIDHIGDLKLFHEI